MGCGETGDGNAVGRAGDVVQADRVAKLYGARLTAMFTADANLQLRADAPTGSYGDANQLPNTILIQHLKRIVGNYTTFDVIRKEPTGIVREAWAAERPGAPARQRREKCDARDTTPRSAVVGRAPPEPTAAPVPAALVAPSRRAFLFDQAWHGKEKHQNLRLQRAIRAYSGILIKSGGDVPSPR